MAGRDVAAVVLLLVGGVVVPVVGWLVGAVMLWSSTAWCVKDKLIATLLVPGGLSTVVLLGVFGPVVSSGSCTERTVVVPARPRGTA
ncbi:MAG: hypothetical protein ACR2KG_07135 [Nocardioidaceae bacterium]